MLPVSKKRPIYGVGINDVDYEITVTERINGKRKITWICPYYRKWVAVLERCFSEKYHTKRPTYTNCTIQEEWKYLSNFIKWVDSQPNKDWQNCDLDKDILVEGNKLYSENTVVFVSRQINTFLLDCGTKQRLTGWTKNKKSGKIIARCRNPITGKKESLGNFADFTSAHLAWKLRKHELACQLADLQDDYRIAEALRNRYK